jgi:hypothetical protein
MGVDTVTLMLDILRETEAAFLVSDGDREVWLPKSQIGNADELEGVNCMEDIEVIVPEWLAEEKGLI